MSDFENIKDTEAEKESDKSETPEEIEEGSATEEEEYKAQESGEFKKGIEEIEEWGKRYPEAKKDFLKAWELICKKGNVGLFFGVATIDRFERWGMEIPKHIKETIKIKQEMMEFEREWDNEIKKIGELDAEIGNIFQEAQIPDLFKKCKNIEDVENIVLKKLDELNNKIEELINNEDNLDGPLSKKEEKMSDEEFLSQFPERQRALLTANSLVTMLGGFIGFSQFFPRSFTSVKREERKQND